MNPIPSDDQPQNDDIDDDDDDEELSGTQGNQKFVPIYGISKPPSQGSSNPNFQFALYPNPSAANFNLPPIIAQTLEMAAAAPPPPLPLLSSTNPLNFNSMPMSMPMANINNVVNANNKPIFNDPVDAQSDEHTDKPSQPTESPNPVSIAQNSVIPHGGLSTNANSLTKPIDTAKAYKPTFVYANPLYQATIYNQYNTFIPYGGLLYPFYQNIQSQSRKNLSKSKEKSPKRRNIIINIS